MYRTLRHRIDAQSLMAAFEQSYQVAKQTPARYRAMAQSAKESLRRHCSEEVIEKKLRAFLQARLYHHPPDSGTGQCDEIGT
jgi:hypothetical protein